jgi:FMN-dependent NADH-azoreductase
MVHLLHIDTSLRTAGSISREVSGLFAEHWRGAHPTGTYTYRDFGRDPVPHLEWAGFTAASVPVAERTAEQHAAARVSDGHIADLEAADVLLLGVPMYNYTVPSSVKAWLDHIVTPRTAVHPGSGLGLFSGRRVVVVTARGGAYGPGMPREPFEFQERYLRAVFEKLGLDEDLTFVNTELTLAGVNPALADFVDQAAESRTRSHRSVRELAGLPVPV